MMPFLAYTLSSCPDSEGLAVCNNVPLMLLMPIFICNACYTQVKCLASIILPQLQLTNDVELLGLHLTRFPFKVLVCVASVMTSLCLVNAMTNAEVIGKICRTKECDSYDNISSFWNQLAEQSLISAVVSKVLWTRKFDFVVEVTFAYMLIAALPLFALAFSVPIEEGVDYKIGEDGEGKFEYHTFYNQEDNVNHGDVLLLLAEASRMEAVVNQDHKFQYCILDNLANKGQRGWELAMLSAMRKKLARSVVRFFFVATVQNALQTNVQLSVMAVTKEATQVLDTQTCISVTISILSSMADVPDILDLLKLMLHAHAYNLIFRETFASIDEDDRYRLRVLQVRAKVRSLLWRFFFFIFLNFAFVSYSAVKLYGYLYCEHHLINGSGCVSNAIASNITVAH